VIVLSMTGTMISSESGPREAMMLLASRLRRDLLSQQVARGDVERLNTSSASQTSRSGEPSRSTKTMRTSEVGETASIAWAAGVVVSFVFAMFFSLL
jgi:hypothetical protein